MIAGTDTAILGELARRGRGEPSQFIVKETDCLRLEREGLVEVLSAPSRPFRPTEAGMAGIAKENRP
jgi:hypothetical protein